MNVTAQATILINKMEDAHQTEAPFQSLKDFSERVFAEATDEDIRGILAIPSMEHFDFGDYEDASEEEKVKIYKGTIGQTMELMDAFKEETTPRTYLRLLLNGKVFVAAPLSNDHSIAVFSTDVTTQTDYWRNAPGDRNLLAVHVMNAVSRRLIAAA